MDSDKWSSTVYSLFIVSTIFLLFLHFVVFFFFFFFLLDKQARQRFSGISIFSREDPRSFTSCMFDHRIQDSTGSLDLVCLLLEAAYAAPVNGYGWFKADRRRSPGWTTPGGVDRATIFVFLTPRVPTCCFLLYGNGQDDELCASVFLTPLLPRQILFDVQNSAFDVSSNTPIAAGLLARLASGPGFVQEGCEVWVLSAAIENSRIGVVLQRPRSCVLMRVFEGIDWNWENFCVVLLELRILKSTRRKNNKDVKYWRSGKDRD